MWFIPNIDPVQWKLIVEARTRIERRDDQDLSNETSDGRTRLENRFRVGFDFSSGKNVSGQIRYQYAHTTSWTPAINSSDENSDLLLGNISFKDRAGTWTVGRQFVTTPSRRLLDISDYGQRSKVFDVVRYKGSKWEAMVGKVAMTSNIRDYAKVGMTMASWTAGQTMAFYRLDEKTDTNHWTIDHRYANGNLNGWFYEVEGALQQGVSGVFTRAWFAHARVQYATSPTTTVYSEGNIASGGEGRLFDPLYGTGHTPYGLSDVQGLRNVRHLEIGVQHRFNKKVTGALSFNGFALFDPRDGWYNNQGNINRRQGGSFIDPSGSHGRDVGQEYDLAFAWTPDNINTIQLEFAVFKPGHFVSSFPEIAKTKDEFWALLSYSARF